jgi:hypothetical protein
MPTPDPFESYPFTAGVENISQGNIYIVVAQDGKKKRVEAPNVSYALKQCGMKNAARVERFDPMSQTLLDLSHFFEVPSAAIAEPPQAQGEAPTLQ